MTSLFDRSISFNTSSGVDFEENPVGPAHPLIVPMGQKHLCGGGNVFIKCVFFSRSCLVASILLFFAKKQNNAFLFLPHIKSIFDAQMHYFLSLISLVLVLPCITAQVIDGSSTNGNFLERAFAEIKTVAEEFSRFSTNSSAVFGDESLLEKLARSPLTTSSSSSSGDDASSSSVESNLQKWVDDNNEWLSSSFLLRDLSDSLRSAVEVCRPAAFAEPKLIPQTVKFPSYSIILKGATCELLENGERRCEDAKIERYQSPTRVIPERVSRAEYRGPTCNIQACLTAGLFPGKIPTSELNDGELLDDFTAVVTSRCGNPTQRVLGKTTFSLLTVR